jgi:phage I-like protein
MTDMRETALQKEADESKVPVEVLRKQRDAEIRANDLERQINNIRFEQWQGKIKADGEALQKEFAFLTQEDLDSAKNYILNTAKNVDMPLEDAVYAVHGKKIVQNLAKSKVQDDLATQSGRKKKTPLAPSNGKPAKATGTLTAEEKYAAKMFGMSEAEYLKNK